MKKLLIIVFGISSILQSCQHDKAKQISFQNKELNEQRSRDLTEPNYYCKVTIGEEEFVTSDCFMISSNAARKERILTMFDISPTGVLYASVSKG